MSAYLSHVFLTGQHQLVVDQVIWLVLEQCGAGMHEYRSALHQGFIALLWVFLGSVEEESTADCHAHLVCVGTARHQVQFVPESNHKVSV